MLNRVKMQLSSLLVVMMLAALFPVQAIVRGEPVAFAAIEVPDNAKVIQGESGTLSHNVASDQSGYTGTGFAVINHNSVSSASYEIEVGSSGVFYIAFRYTAGAVGGSSNNRTLELHVNGTVVGNIVFEGTTAWNNWQNNIQTVQLNEGKNTIMVRAASSGNGICLDKLTLWRDIENPVVYSYALEQDSYTIGQGENVQLKIHEVLTNEMTVETTSEWDYTSSAPAVATVSEGGLVTGHSQGTAVIIATKGVQSLEAQITVQGAPSLSVDFAQPIGQVDPSTFGWILTSNYDVPDSRMTLLGPMLNRETIPVQNLQAVGDGSSAQYQYEESILARSIEGYNRAKSNGLKWYFLIGHHPSWTAPRNNPWGGKPTNREWYKQYIKDVIQFYKDQGAEIDFANLVNENWTGEEDTYEDLWNALRDIYPEAIPTVGPSGTHFNEYAGKKFWLPRASERQFTIEGPAWHDLWESQGFASASTTANWADRVSGWMEEYPEANGKYIIWEENNAFTTDPAMWARSMANVVNSKITHNIKGVIQGNNWNGMGDTLETRKRQHNPAYRTSMWWVHYMFAQLSGEVVKTTTINAGDEFTAVTSKDQDESKIIFVNSGIEGVVDIELNNQPYSGSDIAIDMYKILPTLNNFPESKNENSGLEYQKTITPSSTENVSFQVDNVAANETWLLVIRKVKSAPSFFYPVSPDDGEVAVSKPQLTWVGSQGARDYTVIVSANKDLSEPVVHKSGITGTSYTLETELIDGKRYYWSVIAANEYGNTQVSNNSVYSFVVGNNNAPSQFGPYMPSEGFVNESVTPRFMWSKSYSATSYRLVVSKNSDLSDPVINQSNITSLMNTPQFGQQTAGYYQPTVPLEYDTKYYWMVYASNENGERPMNGFVRSFETKAEGNAPTAFNLLEPAKGAADVSTRAVLSWEPSKNAFFYKLEVSENEDLSNPVVVRDRMIYNKYTFEPNLLKPSITYYWRVTAYTKDLAHSTAASNGTYSFTTEAVVSSPLLYAEQAGDGEAKLWFHHSAGATSHKIVYGTAPGEYTNTIENVSSPHAVTGLRNGTDYYFAVIAVNEHGDSSIWNERTVQPTGRASGDRVYEAEYVQYSGGEFGAAKTHYSGTGYVGKAAASSQLSMKFNVTAASEGYYRTIVRYAAEDAGSPLSVYVNGSKAADVRLDRTGDSVWSERLLVLNLQEGNNTVEIRSGDAKAVYIDNLSVSATTVDWTAVSAAVLSGTQSAVAGQEFELTYGLSDVPGEVFAQDVTFVYDADKLELVAPPLSVDEETFIVVETKGEQGQIRMLGVHLGEAQTEPNRDLLKLRFKVKENGTGIAAVSAVGIVVADGSGSEMQLESVTHNVQIDQIDRAALQALIEEAQGVHDEAVEGYRIGHYPIGSKAILQAAIDRAVTVVGNSGATGSEIEQAATELNAALQQFRNSVIRSVGGDANGDGELTIGDLAILASVYGMTETHPDWDEVKHLDIVADGVIDIADLVALAKRILNW